ncbi:MAG TPA: hypothetical protein VMU41_00810 [Candidatus Binataceae bacterium]|nr:hypothetical protein [Candidatus Binataceae bacterium]
MLSSTVLDVAIGLIFTFLAFSLAVSAIVEAIASLLKLRSATLLQGVKDLLNDQAFHGLALSLYKHALINPRESGKTEDVNPAAESPSWWAQKISLVRIWRENHARKLPAYINSNQFAAAMVDILKLAGGDAAAMKAAITTNIVIQADPQLKMLLEGIVDRTGGKLQEVQKELAGWFDNAMDRVGGDYKRRTQFWSLIIAMVMAILLNVSAINIGQTLWIRPMIAKAIAPEVGLLKELGSDKNPADQFDALAKLGIPVGWTTNDFVQLFPRYRAYYSPGRPNFGICFNLFAGWLITAVAALFGAPFWFDALQQIVRLKGSGPSPAEKADKTAASG